jgi:hypothetical protein
VWDIVMCRSAKTSLAKRRTNYTRGMRVHNVMWRSLAMVREYFVLQDRAYLPARRGRAAAAAPAEKGDGGEVCGEVSGESETMGPVATAEETSSGTAATAASTFPLLLG